MVSGIFAPSDIINYTIAQVSVRYGEIFHELKLSEIILQICYFATGRIQCKTPIAEACKKENI